MTKASTNLFNKHAVTYSHFVHKKIGKGTMAAHTNLSWKSANPKPWKFTPNPKYKKYEQNEKLEKSRTRVRVSGYKGFGEIGVLWVLILPYPPPSCRSLRRQPLHALLATSPSRARDGYGCSGIRFLGLGWRAKKMSRESGEGKGGVRVSGFRVDRGR